jgi:hypothetical protein
MSKLFLTAVASGLLLACSVSAQAADGYSASEDGGLAAQSSNVWRPAAPPVQPSQRDVSNGRRFYSYQPPAVRGRRVASPPYIRPASAKALGNY